MGPGYPVPQPRPYGPPANGGFGTPPTSRAQQAQRFDEFEVEDLDPRLAKCWERLAKVRRVVKSGTRCGAAADYIEDKLTDCAEYMAEVKARQKKPQSVMSRLLSVPPAPPTSATVASPQAGAATAAAKAAAAPDPAVVRRAAAARPVSNGRAARAAPEMVYSIAGFRNPALNGLFARDAKCKVSGHPTFWSKDKSHFMFYQCQRKLWQISPRWEVAPPGGAPSVDLLDDAVKGGSKGIAMQVGDGHAENVWQEWQDCQWQKVELQIEDVTARVSANEGQGPRPATAGAAMPQPQRQPQQSQPSQHQQPATHRPVPGPPIVSQQWQSAPPDAQQQQQRNHALLQQQQQQQQALQQQKKLQQQQSLQHQQQLQQVQQQELQRQREEQEKFLSQPDQPGPAAALTDGPAQEPCHSWLDPEVERRLPPPGEVPRFCLTCDGTPKDWNENEQLCYWGKKAKNKFHPIADAKVDISCITRFFQCRKLRDGRSASELLGKPEPDKDGWFRFPWVDFDEGALPTETLYEQGGKADWQKAWHGTKFEALFSIMMHGKLQASVSAKDGERFCETAPGVYCHKDRTMEKVGNYMRFVPLCRDGVFWAAKLELRVDRSDFVPAKGSDQWVQNPRSVRIAALWVCGRTWEQMEEAMEVQLFWDPEKEANPFDQRFIGRAPELFIPREQA